MEAAMRAAYAWLLSAVVALGLAAPATAQCPGGVCPVPAMPPVVYHWQPVQQPAPVVVWQVIQPARPVVVSGGYPVVWYYPPVVYPTVKPEPWRR